MLRPADLAAAVGGHVDEAGLAHPVEVGAHGVGVQAERLGDLGRAERAGRPRQFEVDRVAGVVARAP